ncbi:MAG: hypothetical protein HY815_34275, partial [Candidatus Riflebacteria bacterium]|nr:hypothetical protein [Candidatus Riflebacteria bacterium]
MNTGTIWQRQGMGLARRLQLSYLVAGLLVGLIGLVGYHYLEEHLRALRELVVGDIATGRALAEPHLHLLELRRLQRELYLRPAPPSVLAETDSRLKQFVDSFSKVTAHFQHKAISPVYVETQGLATE